MKNWIALGSLAIALTSLNFGTAAQAGELDQGGVSAPRGLIVRVDASGNREAFKADYAAKVSDDSAAAEAAAEFAHDQNRVTPVAAAGELDRTSSSEAWFYWSAPTYFGGYTYSYWNYGYSWNYYPCYRWNWGSYSYYYYWY